VLQVGGLPQASAAACFGSSAHVREGPETRRLTLKNLHTPESLDIVFRRGAQYLPEALAQVQVLLRDYRTGEQHPIDPQLLDYLYDVARAPGRRSRVQRDLGLSLAADQPDAARALERRGEHSLHMEGRAIDVRLARRLRGVSRPRRSACGAAESATTASPTSCTSIPAGSAPGADDRRRSIGALAGLGFKSRNILMRSSSASRAARYAAARGARPATIAEGARSLPARRLTDCPSRSCWSCHSRGRA
jgi:uncharacterized protein YcbK (DUF882 family)